MVVPRRRASALMAEAVPGGMRKPTVCDGMAALARPIAAGARVDGLARFAAARAPGSGVREDAPMPGARDDVLRFAIPIRWAATPAVAMRPSVGSADRDEARRFCSRWRLS